MIAPHRPLGSKPLVALLGAGRRKTAFSLVTERWRRGLEAAGWTVVTDQRREVGGKAPDCVVHQDWKEQFSDIKALPGVPLAAVRPWDFGPYPPAWVEVANRECTQLWVHSEWVARQAVESGVEANRLRLVRLGFDPDLFRPEGEVLSLETGKSFHFLFVGTAVQRKGIDILLAAYTSAFSATDDVALVIKDHSGDVFYQGISQRDAIEAAAASSGAPTIRYIDRFLGDNELAALYRSCDVGVFPYRAEGFALPILEMVGSGRPVIVPEFGASLDFCTAAAAYYAPFKRICLPIDRRFAINTLGFEEEVTGVDFCEVGIDGLAATMRTAFESSAASRTERGARGRGLALERFTWQHSVEDVVRCLEEL